MILQSRTQGRLTKKGSYLPGLRRGRPREHRVGWRPQSSCRDDVTVITKCFKEKQRHLRGVQELMTTDGINHG